MRLVYFIGMLLVSASQSVAADRCLQPPLTQGASEVCKVIAQRTTTSWPGDSCDLRNGRKVGRYGNCWWEGNTYYCPIRFQNLNARIVAGLHRPGQRPAVLTLVQCRKYTDEFFLFPIFNQP
jgi:hypothetical protein